MTIEDCHAFVATKAWLLIGVKENICFAYGEPAGACRGSPLVVCSVLNMLNTQHLLAKLQLRRSGTVLDEV